MEPYLAEPCSTPQPLQTWRKSGGTRVEPSWNPGWWNPLVLTSDRTTPEPWCNARGTLPQTTRTTPQPLQPWWQPSWNPRGTLPQTTPDHPTALAEPGGTLVEPWWNPGGTLVEPWWNPRGTLPQTTPDHPTALAEPGGTLVEPWWNPHGTLPQGRPGPPRTLSGLRPQSFQLLGKKAKCSVVHHVLFLSI